MGENLNNNQEPKMEEPKKQENKNQKAKVKKGNKKKKVVITLSTIAVLFLGLQVYASVNGYGNVFFMLKNLITTGNPAGNQEIFSDKDITLSYKSIELSEGLKIQANRLEIKDGKTKLYLSVKSQNEEPLPLKYEVTTKANEGNETTTTTKITGNKPENTSVFEYEDVLTLDYEVEENKTIVLEIKDSSEKELAILEINLETREITVKGEKEFEKISQIELRKYLDAFSLLNDKSGYTESDNLIEIASKIQSIEEKAISTKRETINEVVKQFYGENAKFENTKNAEGKDVEVLKNMKVGVYEKQSDSYDLMEHDRIGKCLKIEDGKFEDGIYTVKYIYLLATSEDESEDKLEELPQYETTIKLKRFENNVNSKYQIVSLEKGTEIKNKISTNVEENEKEQDVTNYITSMNWKKYESVADGLVFEYPADYILVEGPDRGIVVEMTGVAIGKDVNTGKAVESKLKIRMYTTTNISSDEVKYNDKNGTGYTAQNGDKWYTNYIEGHNTPGTAGYQKIENYVNYENLGNGRYLQRMIEFEADNRNNFKITNIINKIMGTIQLKHANNTSTNESSNSSLASERNEYINTTNWVQVWPEWIGMKFKLPVGFTQEQIVRPDQNNVYVDLKGNVTLAQWSENDAERFPITIRFWNENESNLKQEDVLRYDMDRNVKSTDNKGWTDWMPLNEEYGPTTPVESGYIRRGYARMRDGQIERVIFEMKTTGINVDHYKFMNNVLSSISSTSV